MLKDTVKVKITGRLTNSVHFSGEMKIDNLPQLAPILSLYEGVSIEEAGKMLEEARKEFAEKPIVSLIRPFNKTTIRIEREYPARATHFSVSIEGNGKDKTVVLSCTLVKGSNGKGILFGIFKGSNSKSRGRGSRTYSSKGTGKFQNLQGNSFTMKKATKNFPQLRSGTGCLTNSKG